MIYKFLYETQNIHYMLSIRSIKPETGLWEDAMSFSGPYRPFVDTIKTRSSSSSLSLSLLLFMSGRSTFLPPRSSDRLTDSGRLTDSTRANKERPCPPYTRNAYFSSYFSFFSVPPPLPCNAFVAIIFVGSSICLFPFPVPHVYVSQPSQRALLTQIASRHGCTARGVRDVT